MQTNRILGSVVAGFLATSGLLLAAPTSVAAAEAAAPCAGRSGVIVVVDFGALGGGVTKGCDPDGGTGRDNFTSAGYSLTNVQSDAGFVCRVSGKPVNDPCVNTPPASAFWSLWVSDGKKWESAGAGIDADHHVLGGYIAFSWHQGGGPWNPPRVTPTVRKDAVKPSPSAKPTAGESNKGDNKGGKPGKVSPSATPSTSATPSATSSASASDTASASPSASDTGSVTTQAASSGTPAIDDVTSGPPSDKDAAAKDDDGGFPIWLGGILAVLVLGAAGAVPILRRRSA